MKRLFACALLAAAVVSLSCGDGPTTPPNPTTTTTTAPASAFRIQTLLTVYTTNDDLAQFTEGTTGDVRIGRILLGTETLSEGRTVLDNEAKRIELQAAIDRVNQQFTASDYQNAFGETQGNLTRFLNDADSDGWSIDGRSGVGRDWPYDTNGNDPDGWTGQMIVTVSRP